MTTNALMRRLRPVLQAVSWIGLALSLLTLIKVAPRLMGEGGGAAVVLGNLAKYLWTIALLLLVFSRSRTIGARALVGAALAGFFGVASLAVMVGKPFVDRLGPDNLFVPLIFAPITEELLKVMPVGLLLWLSLRSRRLRPSVGDAVLLGVTVAAGFALYENILYVRETGGGWLATLPLSPALPFLTVQGPMLVGGHVVYTGLFSLALGVSILYGRRFPFARYAAPVALAIVLIEHMTVNRLAASPDDFPRWVRLSLDLTLGGYLSAALFLAGVAAVAIYETRAISGGGATLPAALVRRDIIANLRSSPRFAALLQLSRRLRYESLRRSTILAAQQVGESGPDTDAIAAVQRSYGTTGLAIGAAT